MENLFSYGTLQLQSVQIETFGRKLQGHSDCLVGYKLSFIPIEDKAVIASIEMTKYPVITSTNNQDDIIYGIMFLVSVPELQLADIYEADDYVRINVTLRSGKHAWVYVGKLS